MVYYRKANDVSLCACGMYTKKYIEREISSTYVNICKSTGCNPEKPSHETVYLGRARRNYDALHTAL